MVKVQQMKGHHGLALHPGDEGQHFAGGNEPAQK